MVVLCVITCLFLAGMEVDLFIPSFPELIQIFNLTPFMVQLTVSLNFLSYCISSLYVGNLGDRYGRRPVILWGLFIFILGSILCVVANAFWVLLLGRFFQGMGMACPAVLAYVVVADTTPLEKQAGLMGVMNGVVTMAMAFAPVIGSFVNMYFNWRGNFVVLLGLGCFAFLISYFFIPHTSKADKSVTLGLKNYWPLLKSKEYMQLSLEICFLVTAYWTFVSFGPILYMQDMGVNLAHFGFYQGSVLFIFSTISLLSPLIMKRLSQKICMRMSVVLLGAFSILIFCVSIFVKDTPWIITLVMGLYVMPFVFPVNILYPKALDIVPESKGRAAAGINFGRLLMSALGVQTVGYVYTGTFYHLALFIFIVTACALFLIIQSKEWKES